ncbi:MAG: methyl-accepting chemotaxis protein [Desulfuromonadales bacterium]|nr:methyl-accepting chemotaxis protein [Desulfuromonadales bacterium]
MDWFRSLHLGTQLMVSFILVALITALVGMFGISKISRIGEADRVLYEKVTVPSSYVADMSIAFQRVRICLRDMDAAENGEKAGFLAEIKKLRTEIASKSDLYEKTLLTEKGRSDYANFKASRAEYVRVLEKILPLIDAGQHEQVKSIFRLEEKKAAQDYQDKLDTMMDVKVSYGKQVADDNTALVKLSTSVTAGLMVCAVLVSIGFGVLISRIVVGQLGGDPSEVVAITRRVADGDLSIQIDISNKRPDSLMAAMNTMVGSLRDMVSHTVDISGVIAAASSQLYEASAQIATGAEEVAAQAGTVATASEEMSHTSNEISNNCSMAADASQNSTSAANSGAAVVQETITGMNVIADRVRQTAKTIEALGSRSEQIGDIVGTIEDIADQTNLLALNAAIEAARAGEQGRGFAVVADEVRALAERTTKATREIGGMIKTIQTETLAAVREMEEGVADVEKGAVSSRKSGEALQDILSSIGEVAMQISQIATAAEEQTAVTNEVTVNVQQITEVVSDTARSAEETADAASQLAKQARELQELIKRFRL